MSHSDVTELLDHSVGHKSDLSVMESALKHSDTKTKHALIERAHALGITRDDPSWSLIAAAVDIKSIKSELNGICDRIEKNTADKKPRPKVNMQAIHDELSLIVKQGRRSMAHEVAAIVLATLISVGIVLSALALGYRGLVFEQNLFYQDGVQYSTSKIIEQNGIKTVVVTPK